MNYQSNKYNNAMNQPFKYYGDINQSIKYNNSMNQSFKYYNVVFDNSIERLILRIESNKTLKELVELYLIKKQKSNLLIDNFENLYFYYNAKELPYKNNFQTVESFFGEISNPRVIVLRLEYNKDLKDYEEMEVIKDNVLTIVYKAKIINSFSPEKYVAIKKIKKDALKEELKYKLSKNEIGEKDFEKETIKFNRELKNMDKCYCENTVKLYDYFDTDKYFIIIMELCDNNLFYELCNTKFGFSVEEIKGILLQLNNAFKKMHENHISHRDIKVHNILVKYLNKQKTKFKVLLSDYGVSNQLSSMTRNYTTHAGSQIIMAPEILEGEDYNDKCDIWSLGITIYYLHTKVFPYKGEVDAKILKDIKRLGLKVLDRIENLYLKDLLSKMLKINPIQRISWDDYFRHPFFK